MYGMIILHKEHTDNTYNLALTYLHLSQSEQHSGPEPAINCCRFPLKQNVIQYTLLYSIHTPNQQGLTGLADVGHQQIVFDRPVICWRMTIICSTQLIRKKIVLVVVGRS